MSTTYHTMGKTYIDIHKYHSDLLTHVNCGAI